MSDIVLLQSPIQLIYSTLNYPAPEPPCYVTPPWPKPRHIRRSSFSLAYNKSFLLFQAHLQWRGRSPVATLRATKDLQTSRLFYHVMVDGHLRTSHQSWLSCILNTMMTQCVNKVQMHLFCESRPKELITPVTVAPWPLSIHSYASKRWLPKTFMEQFLLHPDARCFSLVDDRIFDTQTDPENFFRTIHRVRAHRLKQMRRIGSVHVIFLLAGHCWWNQDVSQDVSRDVLLEQTTRHFVENFFKQNITRYNVLKLCFFVSETTWRKISCTKWPSALVVPPKHPKSRYTDGPEERFGCQVRLHKCQFVGVGSSFPQVSCFLIFWI